LVAISTPIKGARMFDDLDRLRENRRLFDLLAHYASLGAEDRSIWQHRLMEMEGVEAKELTQLHGELIAFDWIEQNIGRASSTTERIIAGLYRITLHGIRDLRQVQGIVSVEAPETPEKTSLKFPARKKRQKGEQVTSVEATLILTETEAA
jgi:hypothetical protein